MATVLIFLCVGGGGEQGSALCTREHLIVYCTGLCNDNNYCKQKDLSFSVIPVPLSVQELSLEHDE